MVVEVKTQIAVVIDGAAHHGEILFGHALEDRVVACDAETGGVCTTQRIEVADLCRAADVWEIAHASCVVSLHDFRGCVEGALIVGAEEGYGAFESLQVDAAAAARAVVYD